MSIQHVSAVLDARDPRVSGCRKLVLVTLANRTDAQGRCWPSQELLAGECGISVRAISDHLKALQADGIVTRTTKHLGRGNGSRTVYTINLSALQNAPEEIAPAKDAPENNAPANSVECTGSQLRLKKNHQEPTTTEAKASVETRDVRRTPQSENAKGSFLPSEWQPPDEWLADARAIAFKAKKHLSDQELENEADKFRDYWTSQPTAKARKRDWRGTWRNWIRNYLDRRPAARNAPGNRGPDAFSQHGGATIADAAIRRHLQRQNGDGFSDDRGRGHDIPAAPDLIDADYRLVG